MMKHVEMWLPASITIGRAMYLCSELYRMNDSSCARQRALYSIFVVSESLFPIRSHRKCTPSKSLLLS